MSPLVSVVIPTCNRASLLQRALNSVAEQDFRDFEIIVVDDGSEDGTEAMVGGFTGAPILYIRRMERGGGAVARNDGIRHARGRYVAFLDDDDEWLPEKLKRQVAVLENNPEVALVYTGALHIRQEDGAVVKTVSPDRKGSVFRDLLKNNFIRTTSTIMVRREVVEEVGLFDPLLPACQDWDLCLRIAREHKVECISAPLVRFYIHPIRITHDLSARIRGKEYVFQKYLEDMHGDANILASHHLVLGRLYCHNGEMRKGRGLLLQAVRENPFNPAAWKYLLSSFCGGVCYAMLLRIKRKIRNTAMAKYFTSVRKRHGKRVK